jgi:outer membrane lipopolysaccharide assembly protein LptE/RlpB
MPVDLEQLEETLLKKAEEYEGYDNIKDLLAGEAEAYGVTTEEAQQVAANIVKRMTKLHTNTSNNRLGKTISLPSIAQRVAELRF